jgi:hypothetical protein
MMYPDLEIARDRIAELHHLAERADLALAIRRARRAHGPVRACQPRPRSPGARPPASPHRLTQPPPGTPAQNAGTAPAP